MTVLHCVGCGEIIDRFEVAHAAHEPDCAVDPDTEDWSCRCDTFCHVRCCRACAPLVARAPCEALPMASTKGLPKKRTS